MDAANREKKLRNKYNYLKWWNIRTNNLLQSKVKFFAITVKQSLDDTPSKLM